MLTTANLTQILQDSISPVIVISSIGLLLLSMTNRYGRAIDRARLLSSSADKHPADMETIKTQIVFLYRRCRLLQVACSLASLSILLISLTITFLFLSQLLNLPLAALVLLSFIASLLALVLSLVFFIQDVRVSLKALQVELRGFVR